MFKLLSQAFALLEAVAADRARLAVENVALRQQLNVLRRSVSRANLDDSDRTFWILLCSLFENWSDYLVIVKPETVLNWHRKGFAYYWKRKSRAPSGGETTYHRRDHRADQAHLHRQHDLGISANPKRTSKARTRRRQVHGRAIHGQKTIERRFAPKLEDLHQQPHGRQRGLRLLHRAHVDLQSALYVFVVLSHDRRRIVHFNITKNPTAEWTAQQIGDVFKKKIKALGIEEVISSRKSPWQNAFCERVIGTLRRECTDHVIALSENHLRRILKEFINNYYHRARCHLSLDSDAPTPRPTEAHGKVISTPVLGGLHHRYHRAA